MLERNVIAVAGVGDLGKYICEELLASEDFDVVVLSRTRKNALSANHWCADRQIPVHATDYSPDSLKAIFDLTKATTIISLISGKDLSWLDVHSNILIACQHSQTCKRIIPSEWIGDSEKWPTKPDYFAQTRWPFRQILQAQTEVEWTLFNVGWLADYFLPATKTHIRPARGMFPIEEHSWRASIVGTGGELQSWTCAREVGRAVVELCKAEQWSWEHYTYVAGEWNSFSKAIRIMETFYGRSMPRVYTNATDIENALAQHAGDEGVTDDHEVLQIQEMMLLGCLACPEEATMRQRRKYFSKIRFSDLKELLEHAKDVEFV